ncbi:hypothetical protein Syun_018400 [Stephania yunnanensis]|uniref:Uncharacterized protein n=1 Tax=Stephania yunnanensis TaxID=152371 RepID=A0AAP0ITN9_9MAGN
MASFGWPSLAKPDVVINKLTPLQSVLLRRKRKIWEYLPNKLMILNAITPGVITISIDDVDTWIAPFEKALSTCHVQVIARVTPIAPSEKALLVSTWTCLVWPSLAGAAISALAGVANHRQIFRRCRRCRAAVSSTAQSRCPAAPPLSLRAAAGSSLPRSRCRPPALPVHAASAARPRRHRPRGRPAARRRHCRPPPPRRWSRASSPSSPRAVAQPLSAPRSRAATVRASLRLSPLLAAHRPRPRRLRRYFPARRWWCISSPVRRLLAAISFFFFLTTTTASGGS